MIGYPSEEHSLNIYSSSRTILRKSKKWVNIAVTTIKTIPIYVIISALHIFVDLPLDSFLPKINIYPTNIVSFNVNHINKNFCGIIKFSKNTLTTQSQSPIYQMRNDYKLSPFVVIVIKFILIYGYPAQNQKITEIHEKY